MNQPQALGYVVDSPLAMNKVSGQDQVEDDDEGQDDDDDEHDQEDRSAEAVKVPFGFGQGKQSQELIEVTLVDASTGQTLATSGLSVEQLPETFDLATTMHIGADDWQVEKADPIDLVGYVATGRLTLVLRKVETIDPNELLYSLPTLEDALPPMREPDSRPAYAIHEDDWRQREFVSRQFAGEIELEFSEIRSVRREQVGLGFTRVHVRSSVREPLRAVGLSLDDISTALGGIESIGLAVGDGHVIDGFAFPLPGGAAYGRMACGSVEILGLHEDAEPGGLREVANERALIFVDWIRASTS